MTTSQRRAFAPVAAVIDSDVGRNNLSACLYNCLHEFRLCIILLASRVNDGVMQQFPRCAIQST